MSKIKVLIIDDSAVIRKFISDALGKSSQVEVVGTAADPFFGAEKIKKLRPDVITLDIEMPKMDGLTFLSKLMMVRPMPVVMVSTLTESGAKETIKALELGAVDAICKPAPAPDSKNNNWTEFSENLIEIVIAASKANIKRKVEKRIKPLSQNELVSKEPKAPSTFVVAIGASTGGTEVISEIISQLPENFPGIVITQHMPANFTNAFAERINTYSKMCVKEAVHNEPLCNGCVYIAPGDTQMTVQKVTAGYKIVVTDDPPVNRHKPSVDVLFNSVVSSVGNNSVGILLTGMGKDGAKGLLEMNKAGAHTIAQDQASSTVFGMPREAIEIGAADQVKNIEQIIEYLIKNYTLK